MTKDIQVILAFDVGEKRIGVAKAVVPPRIAQPLMTLLNDKTLPETLQKLIADEKPDKLIVGMPRNLQGEKTAQSAFVEEWTHANLLSLGTSIAWQDESLTSVAAEAKLATKKKQPQKGEVDALAATVILTDFLER